MKNKLPGTMGYSKDSAKGTDYSHECIYWKHREISNDLILYLKLRETRARESSNQQKERDNKIMAKSMK
jgi:hypothetical protein